jgi:peptide/nickel transport system permease protein
MISSRLGSWAPVWARFRREPLALAGAVFLVLLIMLAILAPLLPIRDPNHGYYELLPPDGRPLAPGSIFWLGSDANARDMFSRIIWGARISLFIGFFANGLAIFFGVTIGALAAYYGKWFETMLMRFTDVMMAFPVLLFSIALIAIIQRGSVLVIVGVIALFYWTAVARIVRSQVLSIKEKEFVEAARALGGSSFHILRKHVLPHLVPIVLVYGTIGIATTISTEAILSFLGIGVQPPTADWGKMVAEGQGFIFVAPWLVIFPGAMILLTVLAFNLVGDGLRDALDPRQRSLFRSALGGVVAGGAGLAGAQRSSPESDLGAPTPGELVGVREMTSEQESA